MRVCPNCGHSLKLLSYGGLTLDVDAGTIIEMPRTFFSPGEVKLLTVLMEAKGKPVPRVEISNACRKYMEYETDRRIIDVYVSRIRVKCAPFKFDPIRTIRGVGYSLEARNG